MKRNSFVFYSLLLFASACSKSDKSPSPSSGAGISAAVTAQLAKTDSLGDFAKFFNATTLTDAATSGGITILAPSNNAFGNAAITSTAQLPDGSTANDYIIKGILKAADFVNGKTLTTLSGKTLTVSVVADPIILVNGMIINTSSSVASPSGAWMLFGAAQLLNAPAPVFVTVRDATKWSSSNPKGLPAAQATVGLYSSQTATTPAYTGTTDADGVAMINGVQPGKYYVVAGNGIVNSIFSPYGESSNGVIGYVADTVIDNTGKVVFKDENGDSKIDAHDMVTLPGQTIQAAPGQPVNLTLLIGRLYPTIQNYAAAQTMLTAVYAGLTTTYQDILIMDGELSDDATVSCGSQPNWCQFDNLQPVATMTVLSSIWNDAYFNNLNKVNYLIRDVNSLPDANASQKTQMLAEAMVLRDYIYLQLITYFGDIPVEADLGSDFYPYITKTPSATTLQNILSDLNTESANLPTTRTDGGLTKYAALGLAVKAGLLAKNYNSVSANCLSIKNSGLYTLTATSGDSWLTNQSTSETIWAPSFSSIASNNAWYYTSVFPVTVQWCPVLRYTEILLSDAEAQLALGNTSTATTDINIIRARDGLGALSGSVDAGTIQSTWQNEMTHQGGRFANLIRWGTAQTVLGSAYTFNKNLMPIPESYLINYMDIVQNPGY